MSKPYRLEPFSYNPFDQWRLHQSGGFIELKKRSEVFRFDTKEQWEKYLQLNSQRHVWEQKRKEAVS